MENPPDSNDWGHKHPNKHGTFGFGIWDQLKKDLKNYLNWVEHMPMPLVPVIDINVDNLNKDITIGNIGRIVTNFEVDGLPKNTQYMNVNNNIINRFNTLNINIRIKAKSNKKLMMVTDTCSIMNRVIHNAKKYLNMKFDKY